MNSAPSPRRPRRIRRILKWAALSTCILLVATSLVSIEWRVGWFNQNRTVGLGVGNGAFALILAQTPNFMPANAGWRVEPAAGSYEWWYSNVVIPGWLRNIHVPLWMPLLPVAVLCATLFWLDRRPATGYCKQCGLKLRPRFLGRCPKCGEYYG